MGPFDRPVMGGLDDMFDFNRDGKMDIFEDAMEMQFLAEQGVFGIPDEDNDNDNEDDDEEDDE